MSKVSIIVPVFNKGNYLNQSLNSLKKQTLEDIEIILVDDGSTDNSLQICQEFESEDSRIKVITQPNQGVSIARNTGLAHATGKYIGFIDPDDKIEDNMFEEMYRKCEETQAEVSICNYYQEIKDSTIKKELNVSKEILNAKEIEEEILPSLVGPLNFDEPTIMSTVWRLLIERKLIEKNNISFPIGIHRMQDLAFFIEVMIYTEKLSIVDDYLYHYKVHDDSASSVYDVNTFQELIKILPVIEEIINTQSLSIEISQRINKRYLFIGLKSISNEAKSNNPNTFKNALDNIQKICSNERVQLAVKSIDTKNFTSKEKLIINSIKNKNSLTLFVYYRLAEILFH